jgi:hypothetical protein
MENRAVIIDFGDYTAILAFARARLDEDEAAANAAMKHTTGTWEVSAYDVGRNSVDLGFKPVALPSMITVRNLGRRTGTPYQDALLYDKGVAAHVARWDPVRVLAEIETKRAHLWWLERYIRDRPATNPDDQEYAALLALNNLKLLAMTWKQHPNFKPAWRIFVAS